MKRCSGCGEWLERSAFNANRRTSDGLQTWCRACCKGARQRWYHENGGKETVRVKNIRDKDKKRVHSRRRYLERRARGEVIAESRFKKYGVTPERFQQLLAIQSHACGICHGQFRNQNDAYVDHDHSTQEVRGLLCHHCNFLLGNARDSLLVLQAACGYLEYGPANWEEVSVTIVGKVGSVRRPQYAMKRPATVAPSRKRNFDSSGVEIVAELPTPEVVPMRPVAQQQELW